MADPKKQGQQDRDDQNPQRDKQDGSRGKQQDREGNQPKRQDVENPNRSDDTDKNRPGSRPGSMGNRSEQEQNENENPSGSREDR